MTHKLINTGDYLLIVDESGSFKKESPYWLNYTNTICPNRDFGNTWMVGLRDIIGHLPLNNSSILEGVDLLPPLEDEVEKLANEAFPDESTAGWIDCFSPRERRGFKTGYNKAKDKYKYTEEDLIKLLEWVKTDDYRYFSRTGTSQELLGQVIQSLQQPNMPVGFKCVDKIYRVKSGTIQEHIDSLAGYEYYEWVGEYIY